MKRTRWKARLVGGMLAITALGGCKQQLFLEPADMGRATNAALSRDLENKPYDPISPSTIQPGQSPATVLDPSRPARPMSLKECIAIALEHGNIGVSGGIGNAGQLQDTAFNFGGRTISGTDTIRALVLDPALVGADIERSLSKFDARWITSLSWNKQDQAVLNLQQSFSNGDSAAFSTTLAKPLPTGGVAGITVSTQYQKLSNPPTNNQFVTLASSYTPRVQFIFEQPLLQSFGIEVNQLANAHPGSSLISGLRASGGTTTEGILITKIRLDQQKAEFDRQVNQMLLNVEYAYWNLYAAYYNLYAQEDTLKQSFDLYTVLNKRNIVGTLRPQELTQTEAQYWLFQSQALQARDQVLSAERNLRGLLGMNSHSDGMRIVPVDEPTLAPYTPDFYELANDALAHRPELMLARQDLKFRQLDLILQKNQRRPDLRSFFTYDINGLGERLDGPQTETNAGGGTTPHNALASLASNQFNSYQIGLRLDMPLGFRDANAAVRQSRLQIARSTEQLRDAERKTLETVTNSMRAVALQQKNIVLTRQRRLKLQETLDLQKKFVEVGNWDVNLLQSILTVQRDVAASIAAEFQSVAQYNQSLAGLEWTKGTIQQYNNVSVAEGPLPAHVTKKAADHFSARSAALKLREMPAELPHLQSLTQPWDSPLEKLPTQELPGGLVPAKPEVAPAPVPVPTPVPEKKISQRNAYEPAPTTVRPWPITPTSGTNLPPLPAGISGAPTTTTPTNGLPPLPAGVSGDPTFSATDTVRIPNRGATQGK